MLGRVGVGAADGEDPLGVMSERGPDLLTVEHPLVAVEHRARLDVGQVGAGVGLAEALAPQLLAPQDRRKEALLLLGRAEGHDGRAQQALAEEAHPRRGVGLGVLLVEDQLLGDAGVAPSVLLRPPQPDPPAAAELVLPRPPDVPARLVRRTPTATDCGILTDEMLLQPRAEFLTEGLVLAAEVEVHGPDFY